MKQRVFFFCFDFGYFIKAGGVSNIYQIGGGKGFWDLDVCFIGLWKGLFCFFVEWV